MSSVTCVDNGYPNPAKMWDRLINKETLRTLK